MDAAFSADMEVELAVQAQSLVLAFGLGALLGLAYDYLRARFGARAAAVLDTAFSHYGAGRGHSRFAMSAARRPASGELAMTLIGFIMYMYTVSDRVYALFDGALGAVEPRRAREKKIKKPQNWQKFSSIK